MKRMLLIAATAALPIAAPAPSGAQDRGDRLIACPPDHVLRRQRCIARDEWARDRNRDPAGRGLDWGYDRGYRDGYSDARRVGPGDVLSAADAELIREPRRYRLPDYRRDDEWRYYIIGDVIVRAYPDSGRIIDIAGALPSAFN